MNACTHNSSAAFNTPRSETPEPYISLFALTHLRGCGGFKLWPPNFFHSNAIGIDVHARKAGIGKQSGIYGV